MSDLHLSAADAEEIKKLEAFQSQKAILQQAIQKLSSLCVPKCTDTSSGTLSSKETTCLRDCVSRYLEASKAISKVATQSD